jgi:hypothetical protein
VKRRHHLEDLGMGGRMLEWLLKETDGSCGLD